VPNDEKQNRQEERKEREKFFHFFFFGKIKLLSLVMKLTPQFTLFFFLSLFLSPSIRNKCYYSSKTE